MDGGRTPESAADEPPSRPSRRAVLLAALTAVVAGTWLFWPATRMGFHLDDFIHVGVVQGDGVLPHRGPLEMFAFVEPKSDRMGPVQGDYLPWWRGDETVIRFLRPLASLSYYVDYWLWGASPVAYHLSSLAWYAGIVFGCVLLYGELARRSRRGVAAVLLAGLFFALASEHEGNAAWISGRYTLVSVFFCPPALLFYHRWRSRGARRDLGWTLVWFGLALASSETPVALSGFFLAYELSLARDGLADRLRGILPVAALALAWLALYVATGHGANHSAWYIDPIHEPGDFLARGLGGNLPLNVLRLVLPAGIEPEFMGANLRPLGERLYAVFGWAWMQWPAFADKVLNNGLFLMVVVLGLQSVRDRTTRFAFLGALLALVPLSAAPAPQRVLLLPTIGIAWALGAFVADALALFARPRTLRWPWNWLRVALAGVLLWGLWFEWPAARYLITKRSWAAWGLSERALELDVPEGEATAGQRVLLVTCPSGPDALYVPLIRLQQGRGWPEGIWGLSSANGDHVLERTGERSFRLRVSPELAPEGFLMRASVGLFRKDPHLPEGTVLRTGALEVTVAETDGDDHVFALEVAIDLPLDDPNVWLMTWEDYRWKRIAPPAVGESVTLRTRHVPWNGQPGTLQALRGS